MENSFDGNCVFEQIFPIFGLKMIQFSLKIIWNKIPVLVLYINVILMINDTFLTWKHIFASKFANFKYLNEKKKCQNWHIFFKKLCGLSNFEWNFFLNLEKFPKDYFHRNLQFFFYFKFSKITFFNIFSFQNFYFLFLIFFGYFFVLEIVFPKQFISKYTLSYQKWYVSKCKSMHKTVLFLCIAFQAQMCL